MGQLFAQRRSKPIGEQLRQRAFELRLGPRAFAFNELDGFSKALPEILGGKGPVFAAIKVKPEVENEAIGNRKKWRTRTQVQVVADLRKELQIA